MRYTVECRVKDDEGNISGLLFAGIGCGLPDKKSAVDIFARESTSGKWNAVYMEKLFKDGTSVVVDHWHN